MNNNLEESWNQLAELAVQAWADGYRFKGDDFQKAMKSTGSVRFVLEAAKIALQMNDKLYSDASIMLLSAIGSKKKMDEIMLDFVKEYEIGMCYLQG